MLCDDLEGWDGGEAAGRGGPGGKGHMYTYSLFTSLYSTN